MLPPGSQRQDIEALGLRVKKVVARHRKQKKTLVHRLEKNHHDVLVIGVDPHPGLAGIFNGTLVDSVVQATRQTTLYIPKGSRPFVDPQTGKPSIKSVVMPIAEKPSSKRAFDFMHKLLSLLPEVSPQVFGIHCGDMFPFIPAAQLEGLSWSEQLSRESVVGAIERLAAEKDADLIVMSTNGRDTLSQKIIGSFTEQVLAATGRPVLAVAIQD
jgi:nucleotide-binding universal stress UspA family protein